MAGNAQLQYLVRYGVMGHVGAFVLEPSAAEAPARGQTVVIRSARGRELGEVLLALEPGESTSGPRDPDAEDGPGFLRPARPDDLECFRRSERLRAARLTRCQEILDAAGGPIELLDVEPLIDPETVVLHGLGPRDLDLSRLQGRFRSECDFDVVFELVGAGLDAMDRAGSPRPGAAENGTCGACAGSGGGCSDCVTPASANRPRAETAAGVAMPPVHPCRSAGGSHACSGCSVAKWRAAQG
jgi:hypothetical protein